MPEDCISYHKTGYFSNLINDYLEQDESVKSLYNRFPKSPEFLNQLLEKKKNYTFENRTILVEILNKQYQNRTPFEITKENIKALKEPNTFTITTGHQLNLFTGPLYFLYKIISTINLCKELKEAYPEYQFVPVYWMASEDHDFDEINFFNFESKKVVWDREASGAVGELSTESIEQVYKPFAKSLGTSPNAEKIKTLFKNSYLKHNNLSEATRHLANELFGNYGLVILDGNEKELKKLFVPHIKDELFNKTSSELVATTNKEINALPGKNYKLQVNPREINLFYLKKGLRERIIEKDNTFLINNTQLKFSKESLLTEVENHPERFSPNVILRPLYQEVILPNLCYIGGGGELAYWLQLKLYFDKMNVTFPILLLRNSALLLSEKQKNKIEKLNIKVEDLFLPKHQLEEKVTRQISAIKIDFSLQRKHLQQQFKELYELAEKTDKSFIGAVEAQEKKQLNGLDTLEKRLLKAQKRKLSDHLERITKLQDELFPNGSLQERNANFSEFYKEYGEDLIPQLFRELSPLELKFKYVVLE
ncbi:MAG: bacillithiol biosynthesis cysteine-adding enzyme BshC [Flavobacteriaceae bacterium]|nr:bacillithiol biosynthesis cysteine-adding enzyme BshC [Flavobacteriaceae bacterium]